MNDTVPAKLIDSKTGNVVDSITIPGEGTYTVAPDGTVTFVPEKTFTGQASGVEVYVKTRMEPPLQQATLQLLRQQFQQLLMLLQKTFKVQLKRSAYIPRW